MIQSMESISDPCCVVEAVLEGVAGTDSGCCLAEAAAGLGAPECFVATAALPTAVHPAPVHPDLVSLRAFRDQVLGRSRLGRLLIRVYYRWGRYGAAFIRTRPLARAVVRNLLVRPAARLARWRTGR